MNFDDEMTDALGAAAHRPLPDDARLHDIIRTANRRRTGRIASMGVGATALVAVGLGALLVNIDDTADRIVPAEPPATSTSPVASTVSGTTVPDEPDPGTSTPTTDPAPTSTSAPTTEAGQPPDPGSSPDRASFVRSGRTVDVWGDALVARLDPCGDVTLCEVTATDLLDTGGALVAVTTGSDDDASSKIVRFAPDGSLLDDEFIVAPTGEPINAVASTSDATTVWFGQGVSTFSGDEARLYRVQGGDLTEVVSGLAVRAEVAVSPDDRYVVYTAPNDTNLDDLVVADAATGEQLNVIDAPDDSYTRPVEWSATGERLLIDTGVEGADLFVVDPFSDAATDDGLEVGLGLSTACFVDDSTLLAAEWRFDANTGAAVRNPIIEIDVDTGERTERGAAFLGRRLQCRSDGTAVTTTGDGDLIAVDLDGEVTILAEDYETADEAIRWTDRKAIIDGRGAVAIQDPTSEPGGGYAVCFDDDDACRVTATDVIANGDLLIAVQDGEGDAARSFIESRSLFEDAGGEIVESSQPDPITDIAALGDRSRIWFVQGSTLFEFSNGDVQVVASAADGRLQSVAVSPDGRFLAYVGSPGSTTDDPDAAGVVTIVDVATDEVLNTIAVPAQSGGTVIPPQFANPVEWSPQGDRLLVDIGVDEALIALIDPFGASTFDDAIRLGDTVPTACFLGDGSVLAGRWYFEPGDAEFVEGPLVAIDPGTLGEIERSPALWGDELRCHPDGTALIVDPEGRLLRIGPDGDVEVVDEGYPVPT